MVLKRSSVWLLIGMIILSMVLPSLQAMAKEGEKSVDTSLASEEIEDSNEDVEVVEADEVEVEVIEKIEPTETAEPKKTVVDEKMEILVSSQWVNVPKGENPSPVTLSLVNTQTGEQVKSVTLANGEKSYLFDGLSKYGKDGSLNKYGLKSSEVANYKTTIDNYTATHTYIQSEAKDESAVEETKEIDKKLVAIMPMAIANPGHYNIGSNSIVVPSKIEGVSTNAHTLSELVWSNGDIVYAAIKSTHALEHMVLNGVITTAMDQYNANISIFVNRVEYKPNGLNGNTDDSHWTVFKFNLADLKLDDSGKYTFFVKGIGKGHDVGGTLLFEIPKENITGEKFWVGGTERPAITLQLKRHVSSGTKVDVETGVVNGNEATPWKYKWEKVSKYDPYGRQYIYTVDEVNIPPNYTKSLDGLRVTNTYDPTLVFVNVNKVWIGPATESVTIKLYADNVDTGKTVVLNGNNSWRDVFTGLNKFNDRSGDKINYSVEEVAIDGYSTVKTVAENGFTFTNTNDAKITVDVVKEWDGRKTDFVTITLVADGVDTTQTLVLNKDNDWGGSFKNLRRYDATSGKEIEYSVREKDVPDGYEVSYSPLVNGKITVTNTEKVGSLKVIKVDEDEELLSGATFELRDANGNLIGTETTGSSGEAYFGNLSWGDYQLIETKAPNGYRKLLQPISITIGPGDLLHIEKTVVNTKTGWQIPKTGGIGTAGFYGFGALVMALTLGFFLRKRKPTE
jgi:LPXTG-motif cell wall-anchored protein